MNVTDIVFEGAKKVYSSLTRSATQSLSRTEILNVLEKQSAPYYYYIINSLSLLKKVTKNLGYYGGISLAAEFEGNKPELSESELSNLKNIIKDTNIKEIQQPSSQESTQVEEQKEKESEKRFYKPLKDYFEESGLYEIVGINSKQVGSKWENADLALIKYQKTLKYHPSIDLSLTAVEVKRSFPTIEDIQQTNSYLQYANAAYICYFDDSYRGSGIDTPLDKLRNAGLLDLIDTFELGVVVAYHAQQKGSKLYFQILREAPRHPKSAYQIEQGIDLWLGEAEQKQIEAACKHQLATLLGLKT